MAWHDYECVNCGLVTDFIIDNSILPEKNKNGEHDLKKLKKFCKKCRCTKFIKLIAITAKMPDNWASWQKQPGPTKTNAPSKLKKK